ncbi:MAG TPA: VWA domain-containing protein [Verrucomicrobiae bacterium]|nr:VWA domain-containing protein [Verrucomicrobiae bacterium]
MKFAQPLWLLAGLIACAVLVWRYRRFDVRQRNELAKFASASLVAQLTASVSPARRQLKRALVIAGVALVAIALARPLVGFRWEEAKRKGLDVMIAVDTSKSMLAQDVKPDRLTRAKMAVEDLLAKMDGDRVGLVAFAGNSFLQCPLTLDYDAFRQSLDALDTKIIPRGGTDIAAAIHETEAALEGNGNNERILVLLTDGEDLEGSALDAARAAAKNGLKIFTVGVGSASGELIPAENEAGGTQFVKDASGQLVKSHLDESMLQQIAEATGAMYQPLGQQAQGLDTIYTQGLAKFTRHEIASRMQKVFIERFQWPLALGLFCLVLEPLIGIRRNQRVMKPVAGARPALATAWNHMARPAAAVALLVAAGSAQASVGTAEQAFQKGDYPKAEQEYRQAAAKNPDKPVLQFNHGTAAYKSGVFDQAAESFAKAMKTDDLALQQDDYYNLGNTQYRLGQKTEKANAQETIKTWEQAVQSYEAALQLKPADADAKYNRDLVKRKLEQLKKQEQQKQDQQKQQQNQDQKDQDQKDQDKKNDQQNKPDQQNQGKQDDKKDQPDKQDGSSGQDKPDQKSGKDQKQPQDQQAKSGADKDQNKPDDKKDSQDKSNSDQQAKQEQQQDKQNGSAGQQDKQEQANQKPEPKDQTAQAGQKKDEQKKDGQPQPRNGQPKDDAQEQADVRSEPGKMSRDEAKQLLDSLKSDDRKMPLAPASRGTESAQNDEPVKDW